MSHSLVIIGGFFASPAHYKTLARHLKLLSGTEPFIVPIRMAEWSYVIHPAGWRLFIRRLDETIRGAMDRTGSNEIIVVAHSLGGVVTRLYLSKQSGKSFKAQQSCHVCSVITLGSPHSRGLVERLTRWNGLGDALDKAKIEVPIFSVAGSVKFGSGSPLSTVHASNLRHKIHGAENGEAGDGVIPVASAIYDPKLSLVMPDVRHDKIIGRPWYGDPEIIDQWWERATQSLLISQSSN